MRDFFHALKQIFAGLKKLDEKNKYQMISIFIAFPHIIFFAVFSALGVDILYIYNFFVVVFYISMAVLLGRGRYYTFIFFAAFIEILFHSALASVLLGWNWGFMTYTTGLIPMVFYMAFTLSYLKKGVIIPAVVSFIVCIVYFVIRIITMFVPPMYVGEIYDIVAGRIYMFNMVLTFFFLLFTSTLFSIEIRFMQSYLESENNSLSIMANYDPLTRLMNRRSMNSFLKGVMADAGLEDGAFCLMMLDIDDFKRVNDTYGHSAGDVVLVNVAKILQDNVREVDRVCRWGGEEIIIFVRSNMEAARQAAERICAEVRNNAMETDAGKVNITLTIGVAEYSKDETIRSMMETADRRLYRGKREGKNRVIWR